MLCSSQQLEPWSYICERLNTLYINLLLGSDLRNAIPRVSWKAKKSWLSYVTKPFNVFFVVGICCQHSKYLTWFSLGACFLRSYIDSYSCSIKGSSGSLCPLIFLVVIADVPCCLVPVSQLFAVCGTRAPSPIPGL